MALLVIPAGIFIAPLLATRNELAGLVAPPGTETEAYTWPLTAIVAGIAGGAALAGVLVDAAGWRTAAVDRGRVRGGGVGARAGAARDVAGAGAPRRRGRGTKPRLDGSSRATGVAAAPARGPDQPSRPLG